MNRFFLCLSFLTLLHINIYGQVSGPVPTVTAEMRFVPAEEVFAELEKQTGMFFSYESSLLKELPEISLVANEESFSYCLKRIFEDLPVTWRITGQYVILKRKPRQFTISGFIRDSVSLENFINATVYDKLSGKGVATNNYGFYSITLPAGDVCLSSSYVGFDRKEIRFSLKRDTLIEILLHPMADLHEVVVKGQDLFSEILNSRMGNTELSVQAIRQRPVIFSEPDPLRTIHLTSGVASGLEGLSGMYVRGGGGEQNLFLLDGIPIYNINHVGGLFSTFNSDVIKNVDFYKGGFPARYGGRLSSVMDIRLKDGDMHEYHGNITFGLLAARAQFEGPLIKNKTSFNVAFRRSWLDAITTPAISIYNRRSNDDIFYGFSFYDLNAKITHKINSNSRIYANFYMGQDRLRYREWEDLYFREGEMKGHELIWRWGNLVSSVNWAHAYSSKLFMNMSVSYSRYASKMSDAELKKTEPDKRGSIPDQYRKTDYQESGIEDFGYQVHFDYTPATNHMVRFGTDFTYHLYHPDEHSIRHSYIRGKKTEEEEITMLTYEKLGGQEWNLYAEDDWLLNDRWKMNVGGRLGTFHIQNKTYISCQPRLSARYLVDKDFSLKASYSKMNQYVTQLSTLYANMPSDIWVPVTKNVKPMYSHLVSAGAYYQLQDTYRFSVEGYFKRMKNVIDYQDYALLIPIYKNWDEKISVGTGRSYGVEFSANKDVGRFTGWASYTLSWTDRIYKDGKVNRGERFRDKYDNRHKFNITTTFRLNKKADINASWVFASGNRATIPVDYYYVPGIQDHLYKWNPTFPVYEKNAFKMNNYHRLDLSMNFYRPKKKGRMGIWNISVYNAYCHINPIGVSYYYMGEDKLTVAQKGIFPILPSFSYTYKF